MRINSDSSRNEVFARDAAWLDALVEQAWRELGGKTTRERVREIAAEVLEKYPDATITAFIPIFVKRTLRDRLRSGIRAARRDEIAESNER